MCFCVIFWVQPNQCGHTQLEELILPIFVNWNIGHNTINNGVCSYFINTVYKYWIVHWKCTMKLQYVLMKNIEIYSGLHKIYIKIKNKIEKPFQENILNTQSFRAVCSYLLTIGYHTNIHVCRNGWMDGWMQKYAWHIDKPSSVCCQLGMKDLIHLWWARSGPVIQFRPPPAWAKWLRTDDLPNHCGRGFNGSLILWFNQPTRP